MTTVLPVGPAAVRAVAEHLNADGVAIIPTDTVYGLAVRASHPTAAAVLASAKGRPHEQPIAVLVAGIEQVERLAPLDQRARSAAERWWPGPLTLVLPRRTDVSFALGAPDDTIGVRHPASSFVRSLCEEAGPLAVTSANAHGQPTPVAVGAAVEALADRVDVAVDGGDLTGEASTVLDLTSSPAILHRPGPLDPVALGEVVGPIQDRHGQRLRPR